MSVIAVVLMKRATELISRGCIEDFTPSKFVPRLASELDVFDQIRQRARRSAEEFEAVEVTTGVRPAECAVVCLYKPSHEDWE